MIPLTSTTDKLQAFLAAAAATTNPTVTVVFYDVPQHAKTDTSDYRRTRQFTVLAGTAETDICAAPGQGTIRHIEYINIYNADTANVTVTVAVDDNATNRILRKAALSPAQTLFWTPEHGWQIANDDLVSGWTIGTEAATTSGTTVDFTGIPSWAKRILVSFMGVSTNGTSGYLLQLGDSGGIETSGYLGATGGTDASGVVGTNWTAGAILVTAAGAGNEYTGQVSLALEDSTNNVWSVGVATGVEDAGVAFFGAGQKPLSSTLDRVRITTINGTDTFDAGAVNILYS